MTTKSLTRQALHTTGMTLRELAAFICVSPRQLEAGRISAQARQQLRACAVGKSFGVLKYGVEAAMRRMAFTQEPKLKDEILKLVDGEWPAQKREDATDAIAWPHLPRLLMRQLAVAECYLDLRVPYWEAVCDLRIEQIQILLPAADLSPTEMRQLSAQCLRDCVHSFAVKHLRKLPDSAAFDHMVKWWHGKDHTHMGIDFDRPLLRLKTLAFDSTPPASLPPRARGLVYKTMRHTGMSLEMMAYGCEISVERLRAGRLHGKARERMVEQLDWTDFRPCAFGLDAALRRLAFAQRPQVSRSMLTQIDHAWSPFHQRRAREKIYYRMIKLLVKMLSQVELPGLVRRECRLRKTPQNDIGNIQWLLPLAQLTPKGLTQLSAAAMKRALHLVVLKSRKHCFPDYAGGLDLCNRWQGKNHTHLGLDFGRLAKRG